MKSDHPYWAWRWWVRWFVPLPILVWCSKRKFRPHLWYYDEDVIMDLRRHDWREEDGLEK